MRTSLQDPVSDLLRLLSGGPAVVLSGAGCSTGSGIPDYRGPDGRLRARLPMTYQEFVRSPASRARYWSRSAVGWPRMRDARANGAHRALARLEAMGLVRGVITQNVDGLHQAGGSREVLELHGSLARVRCLGCGAPEPRSAFQDRLLASNPGLGEASGPAAPDGDAAVPHGLAGALRVPGCLGCGGVLKPDVVFFGESVPAERVTRAWELYEAAGMLLVVGSSLSVFSGRRFVLRAHRDGRPVAMVTLGPTRCDEMARLKAEARLERFLPRLAEAARLSGTFGPAHGPSRTPSHSPNPGPRP